MDADNINVALRARRSWEAVDLGFVMVRQWLVDIYFPWVIFCIFISAVSFLSLPSDYADFASLIVWWLKPLFDRFLLFLLHRKASGKSVSTSGAFAALPQLISKTGLWSALTYRRFSLTRGLNLPIWQLEQLRGKKKSVQQRGIYKGARFYAIGIMFALISIEVIVTLSFYLLIVLLAPDTYRPAVLRIFFFIESASEDVDIWISLLSHMISTLSIILIEPFYVAATYALYLNQRVKREALDLHLALKKIGQKLDKTARNGATSIFFITCCCLVLLGSIPSISYADDKGIIEDVESVPPQRLPASEARSVIKKITERDELATHKVTEQWSNPDSDTTTPVASIGTFGLFFSSLIPILSTLLRGFLWLLAGVGVFWILIRYKRWISFIQPQGKSKAEASPDIAFGLDLRHSSLPDNIPETARSLWQQQQQRESLSLLYRGALAHLVEHDHLRLKESDTEGDIVTRLKKDLSPKRHAYLTLLSQQWQQVAYAHHSPHEESVLRLFDSWHDAFTGDNDA